MHRHRIYRRKKISKFKVVVAATVGTLVLLLATSRDWKSQDDQEVSYEGIAFSETNLPALRKDASDLPASSGGIVFGEKTLDSLNKAKLQRDSLPIEVPSTERALPSYTRVKDEPPQPVKVFPKE